ncbi:hypothetical protein [Mitsuaria sp. 7]|uniref:hypothetical protein n=1 Tax=Mitsuaria sp. 7 TaxID=1658665 RepID=UPI0012F964A5|nr:hypothetical protein [Mitsuaria sp. 7]
MSSPFPFFVMLSESIELEQLANALGELIPAGHRVEVVNGRDPIQAPIGDDVGFFAGIGVCRRAMASRR